MYIFHFDPFDCTGIARLKGHGEEISIDHTENLLFPIEDADVVLLGLV